MKQLRIYIFRILILIFAFSGYSQNHFPTNYFRKPLDIPLILSGTFGELRTNHFHAGLDLKTQQREGLNVFSSAEGYVSRIKISHWGYGKALYVTHPNGYTTVYAHLKKFSKKIETYIRNKQYAKESFEIQVFPKSDELKVSKGEIVAYSGSTGGFVGPHLHFEIRDSKTEKPINPMFFGIDILDNKAPTVARLMAYTLNDNSQVNGTNKHLLINFKQIDNVTLYADTVKAFGRIGFGINAYDRLDGALNKNGIYSLEMLVNNNKVYEHQMNSFSFAESKYINLLIDYERYATLNQKVQKCFVEPDNKLSIYKNLTNKGYLFIEEGQTYDVIIKAKDYKGNKTEIKIPVIGEKDSTLIPVKRIETKFFINKNNSHTFEKDGIQVSFLKNTFYNSFNFDFDVDNSIATIHKPTVPVHKNFTLTFDVSNYSEEEKEHLFISRLGKKGSHQFMATTKKGNKFSTQTKILGKYTLYSDNQEPNIRLSNFKDKQWLTKFRYLKVKISDKISGIKSYRAEIDDHWILMEYNVKNGILTYDFNDKKLEKFKHKFNIEVEDIAGNKKKLTATFFRKK